MTWPWVKKRGKKGGWVEILDFSAVLRKVWQGFQRVPKHSLPSEESPVTQNGPASISLACSVVGYGKLWEEWSQHECNSRFQSPAARPWINYTSWSQRFEKSLLKAATWAKEQGRVVFWKGKTELYAITKQRNQWSERCNLSPWAETQREKGSRAEAGQERGEISREEERQSILPGIWCNWFCMFWLSRGAHPCIPLTGHWKPATCKARLVSHRSTALSTSHSWLLDLRFLNSFLL